MRPDFSNQNNSSDCYDLEYDKLLIEQSIATQYGILPSIQGELHYSDWSKLVGGLMADTPLGQVVRIRTEKDPKLLKQFSPEQRRLRREWQKFKASGQKEQPVQDQKQAMANLERMIAGMFGGR